MEDNVEDDPQLTVGLKIKYVLLNYLAESDRSHLSDNSIYHMLKDGRSNTVW